MNCASYSILLIPAFLPHTLHQLDPAALLCTIRLPKAPWTGVYLVPIADPVATAVGIQLTSDRSEHRELLAERVRPFEEDTVLANHFEAIASPVPKNRIAP
jgi:hypothetical protein